MNILFAIKALDNVQGGAERVLADITSGLADKGHNISILSFDKSGGQSFYPLNEKVKRIALGIGDVTRNARFHEVIARMVAIRKTTLKAKPDAVIAFMHSTFIPASFALIGTGIPVIASEHIVPEHYKNKRWEYILLLLSHFFVKKITVLSQTIIKSYSSILHPKMVAIENPVHPAQALANTQRNKTDKKIILNVGRLTPQKDQETLIKAFKKISNDHPEWHLKIIGEGELRENLEKQIQELNVESRVSLPGITSDIEHEYQNAHIFALSSKYESFGLVTAEAMAHRLPAIGFASCPGTNEIINNKINGLLVDGSDKIEAFAQGLKQLIEDEELRKSLGEAGLKSVEKFHPDIIVEKWENLIKDAIQAPEKTKHSKLGDVKS